MWLRRKLGPLPPLRGLSPWAGIAEWISDCMKGRTHTSQSWFCTLSITSHTSLCFCPLVTVNCFKTCTNLFPQEKLNMAFQYHALYLIFWSTLLLGLDQPRYIPQSLEDTSYPLHSQPCGYQYEMTPSFSFLSLLSSLPSFPLSFLFLSFIFLKFIWER